MRLKNEKKTIFRGAPRDVRPSQNYLAREFVWSASKRGVAASLVASLLCH